MHAYTAAVCPRLSPQHPHPSTRSTSCAPFPFESPASPGDGDVITHKPQSSLAAILVQLLFSYLYFDRLYLCASFFIMAPMFNPEKVSVPRLILLYFSFDPSFRFNVRQVCYDLALSRPLLLFEHVFYVSLQLGCLCMPYLLGREWFSSSGKFFSRVGKIFYVRVRLCQASLRAAPVGFDEPSLCTF